MAFRLAIGGISHETNNYCKDLTPRGDFHILQGDEILRHSRGVRSYIGGMIDAADDLGATVVPTFVARATPSGTIAGEAYRSMLADLLSAIRAAAPVDAIALALHGAGVAEDVDDVEGHLCRAVRETVGPDVKIVVTLDLHGNITQSMADAADLSLGCHLYPHTDAYDRGREAVEAIPRLLSGEWRPVTHVEYLPMLLAAASTNLYPAQAVNELCRGVEGRPGMLDCTFFHGFPYTDIPWVRATVVAASNGSREAAGSAAKEVARWIWEHRDDFRRETLTPREAIERALAIEGGPVVINDTADNAGGGAPADGTHVLRAMLAAGLENACFGFMYDPDVAEQAHRAGVGTTIDVTLGGKYDAFHGAPLALSAYVKCLSDGRFIQQSPMSRGAKVDFGRMARLQAGGLDIVVSSVRSQTLDPEVFLLHGIDISRYKIVAVKSSAHFRAGFQPVARAIVTADSPGLTTLNVAYFPRARTPRPIWPLDDAACYTP
ncbi:MAG: M81 family metallopeptidase [Bacillota bacterium]|nr:M81 family metallopeptidase [Bacillota bacterium]